MCMCTCALVWLFFYLGAGGHRDQKRVMGPPGAVVADSCEPPDVSVETELLSWKISTLSHGAVFTAWNVSCWTEDRLVKKQESGGLETAVVGRIGKTGEFGEM